MKTKCKAAILKFCAPAIITSRWVIIARYNAIFDQSNQIARISIITGAVILKVYIISLLLPYYIIEVDQ